MATLDQAKIQIEENGADLPADHPIADGKFHRYGRGADKNKYWYRLIEFTTDDGQVLVTGSFGYWVGDNENRQDIAMDWSGITPENRAAAEKKRRELEAAEAARKQQAASNAAIRAGQQWAVAAKEGQSDYVARKQVTAPGVRYQPDGTMLIPVVVLEAGAPARLVGLQKIAPDGEKRFSGGMAMKAGCCPVGKVESTDAICMLWEGWATARSCRMALQDTVGGYVAFNAGNLMDVALMMRARHPAMHILIAADDDHLLVARMLAWVKKEFKLDCPIQIDGVDRKLVASDGTEVRMLADWRKDARGVPFIAVDARAGRKIKQPTFVNTGVAKAAEAARAVGNASIVVPHFVARGENKWTDFNDLHVNESLDEVAGQLQAAIFAALNPGEDEPEPADDAGAADELYGQALQVVQEHQRASISLVQRHLQIGYNRAARLLEEMERQGAVSPMQSNGNREVLAASASNVVPLAGRRKAGAAAATSAGAAAGGNGTGEPPDWPGSGAGEPAAEEDNWEWRLARTEKGKILPTLANVYLILENHESWKGVIADDEFSGQVLKLKVPPFANGEMGEWTDKDDLRCTLWMQQKFGFAPRQDVVMGAVLLAADLCRHHPVRAYLGGLAWDGAPRLERWIIDRLGAEDTLYNRTVARKWLIAAVARIYKPGCKADNVLILEGEQGIYKSTALKVLGGEWFTDAPFRMGDKDAYVVIRGKWIVELAELDSFNKADSTGAKLFFGQYIDRYRNFYGKRAADVPRQQLFAGTTNSDAYLKDDTGNRRYWPVKVTTVDLEGLKADRDQIWAEAVAMFRAGVEWWPTSAEKEMFEDEQDERYVGDAYITEIRDWLVGRDRCTMNEILRDALKLDMAKWTRPEQQRIGRCMAEMKWHRQRATKPTAGKRDWTYVRPAAEVEAAEKEIADGPL